jgi:hypothetical protein
MMKNICDEKYSMMIEGNIILGITGFVIMVILMMEAESTLNDMTYVRCKSNGYDYKVRNLEDKEEAAEMLGRTHEKLKKAVLILKRDYPDDERIIRLSKRFQYTSLAEAEGSGGHTSYSINKGEKIVLCLRSKDGRNRLVDENLLLFVALHELSHIMTISKNHTPEFWSNFKFVLETCQRTGLYSCIDFSSNPREYCGITVTNSPASCSVK